MAINLSKKFQILFETNCLFDALIPSVGYSGKQTQPVMPAMIPAECGIFYRHAGATWIPAAVFPQRMRGRNDRIEVFNCRSNIPLFYCLRVDHEVPQAKPF
jgi:hypothetical protein